MVDVRDRISGGLLGVAAGDALGATLEFMAAADIRRKFGVHREIIGRGPFRLRPGQGTDDTDLTWAVLAAYLDGPYALERVADNFLDWFRSGPPDVGNATTRALERLEDTRDPRKSGNTASARAAWILDAVHSHRAGPSRLHHTAPGAGRDIRGHPRPRPVSRQLYRVR